MSSIIVQASTSTSLFNLLTRKKWFDDFRVRYPVILATFKPVVARRKYVTIFRNGSPVYLQLSISRPFHPRRNSLPDIKFNIYS